MQRFLVEHQVKPEKLQDYRNATLEMVQASRRADGVQNIELLQHSEHDHRFHLLEVYFHEGGHEAYTQSPQYLAWRETLEKDALLSAPEIRLAVEKLHPDELLDPECGPESKVSLREVDDDNVGQVIRLKVSESQDSFVAPNEISLAQAYAVGESAWVRAIYAAEVPVGFVMLSIDLEKPRFYLWRYMVDRRYQRMGFGRQALEQVVEYVRAMPNASEIFLSYVPGEGSPKEFYEQLGFRDTGVEHGGELEMRLVL